jgi:signal transduction histidine kinase
LGDHRTIRITVQDTGTGVLKEKLHLLFQPFSQVASATGAKAMGTGLGLTIVKRLLEAMNGTILFESEPGAASISAEVVWVNS